MIVYAWPPAGGPGVQRCLKFAKYLTEFGWEPVVLTVERPETSSVDASLLEQVPKDLKAYKTGMFEPFTLYRKFTGKQSDENLDTGHLKAQGQNGFKERLASWVRLNFFIPDAKIGWWRRAVSEGKRIIEEEDIKFLLSSGPPHTTHLIARSLSVSRRLPWIADFRDPWTDIDYYHFAKRTRLSTWIDIRMELACIQSASATTTVSKSLVELIGSKPKAPDCYLLPNGYDPSDLPSPDVKKDATFKIYYGGNLSADRIPHALLRAMAALRSALPSLKIELLLAGRSCKEFEQLIDDYRLREIYSNVGNLPHHQASSFLVNADLSLLVINNVPHNGRIVTGKIFEYMGAKNPILAIGPLQGDAAKLLKETNSGEMFDYEDHEGIASFLSEALKDPLQFKSKFRFDCSEYSRRNITRQLAEIFDGVLSKV